MKNGKKQTKNAGVMRNDLPGFMRVRGNKIYIRYKGKDIATGCSNTKIGWQMANAFWADKSQELELISLGVKSPTDTIGNIFKQYVEYSLSLKKWSSRTLKSRITAINHVFPDTSLLFTEENIRKCIDDYARNTKITNATTFNTYLKRVNVFLGWASDEERGLIPNAKYIKRYTRVANKRVKPSYSVEEYELLIEYFSNKNIEITLFLRFLWHTGARCGESLAIRVGDVDLEKNRISVANKIYKGTQEFILLGDNAMVVVEELMRLALIRNDGYLFACRSTNRVQYAVYVAESKLGIHIKYRGLHGFRRSYADRLLDAKLDIPTVQEVMRHRNIQTTIDHYKSMNQRRILDELNTINI